jgi:hypothetical protein
MLFSIAVRLRSKEMGYALSPPGTHTPALLIEARGPVNSWSSLVEDDYALLRRILKQQAQ